jgi:hypothetical protein
MLREPHRDRLLLEKAEVEEASDHFLVSAVEVGDYSSVVSRRSNARRASISYDANHWPDLLRAGITIRR